MTLLADEVDIDGGSQFSASCTASETVGDFVFVSGGLVAGLPAVRTVDPLVVAKMPTFGVIVNKTTATICTIQTSGVAASIASGLAPGAVHWLGLDGRAATTGPTAGAGSFAYKQRIGIAVSPTDVLLSFGEPYKLTN